MSSVADSSIVANVTAGLASLPADVKSAIFLADLDRAQKTLTVHARSGCNLAVVDGGVRALVRDAQWPFTVIVRQHKVRDLAFPRSIEAWLRTFCAGQPVYDPTGVATRARALLEVVRMIRAGLGKLVAGVYFDPGRREILVRNRHRQSALGPSALAEISAALSRAWSSDGRTVAHVPVRSIERIPNRVLIPVEDSAFASLRAIWGTARSRFAFGAVLVSLAGAVSPAAAHSDARATGFSGVTQRVMMAEQFGILAGLSLFGDEGARDGGAFGALGLDHYFSPRTGAARTQSAEWRWFWEKEFWEPQTPPRGPHDNPYGGY